MTDPYDDLPQYPEDEDESEKKSSNPFQSELSPPEEEVQFFTRDELELILLHRHISGGQARFTNLGLHPTSRNHVPTLITYNHMDFTDVCMPKSVLLYSHCQHCYFDRADLSGSLANPASLRYSTFREATLEGTNFASGDLVCCDFSKAKMRKTCLVGVQAESSDFIEADLQGADLAWGMFNHACFNGADLRGANLENANLTLCSFVDADLRGANFTGASMLAVLFYHTKIDGIWQFTDCQDRCIIQAEQFYDSEEAHQREEWNHG